MLDVLNSIQNELQGNFATKAILEESTQTGEESVAMNILMEQSEALEEMYNRKSFVNNELN